MAASPVNRPRNARESGALPCAQSQCGRTLDESEPAFSVEGKLRK